MKTLAQVAEVWYNRVEVIDMPNEIIKRYVQEKQAKLYKDTTRGVWLVTTPNGTVTYNTLEEMVQAMYQELIAAEA